MVLRLATVKHYGKRWHVYMYKLWSSFTLICLLRDVSFSPYWLSFPNIVQCIIVLCFIHRRLRHSRHSVRFALILLSIPYTLYFIHCLFSLFLQFEYWTPPSLTMFSNWVVSKWSQIKIYTFCKYVLKVYFVMREDVVNTEQIYKMIWFYDIQTL